MSELYPEIVDAAAGEDPLPSCSAVEALERQEPFINQTLAASALAMLARLFRYRSSATTADSLTRRTGQMSALPVDPQLWSKTQRDALGNRDPTKVKFHEENHVQRTCTSPAGPRGVADGHAFDADQIRVNIVPKKLKDGDNDALTTPLSVTGTAEDLDAELSTTIVSFVGSHLQMKNTLEKAKAEMDAASKAAQAEARAKSKTPAKAAPAKTEVTQNAPPPSLPNQ